MATVFVFTHYCIASTMRRLITHTVSRYNQYRRRIDDLTISRSQDGVHYPKSVRVLSSGKYINHETTEKHEQ